MEEKIEQLCDQIKDLLKENDREYIVAITPEETYTYPDFTFPEYFKNIIDNSEYGFNELLCDDSIDIDWDDFILDEDEEPVYVDDYDEEVYDDEEYDEEKDETTLTIYGDPKSYALIQKFLEEQGFENVGGEFTYIPNDLKEVNEEQRATIDKMVEKLEEFDDVQNVYTNMK